GRGRAVGGAGRPECQPVLSQRWHPRIDLAEYMIASGDGLADTFAAAPHRVSQGTQDGVQFRRVGLGEHIDGGLEDRVDLDGYVARPQHGAGRNVLPAGVIGVDQVDIFGAEQGGGPDLGFDIGRNVSDLAGVEVEFESNGLAAFDARDSAHLYAA